MNNYFTLPLSFSDSESIKAERNPKFCESQNVSVLNKSVSAKENVSYEFEIVERKFNLPKFTKEELQEEQWKTIEGFENYQISNLGRVYSFVSNKILKPCLSPANKRNGQNVVIVGLYDFKTLNDKGKWKTFSKSVHSLVLSHFTDYKDLSSQKLFIFHKNNCPFDCRLTNLYLSSMTDYKSIPTKEETERFVLLNNSFTRHYCHLVEENLVNDAKILFENDFIYIIEMPSKDNSFKHIQHDVSNKIWEQKHIPNVDLFIWWNSYVMTLPDWFEEDIDKSLSYIESIVSWKLENVDDICVNDFLNDGGLDEY